MCLLCAKDSSRNTVVSQRRSLASTSDTESKMQTPMKLCKNEDALKDSDGWDGVGAALQWKFQGRLADT